MTFFPGSNNRLLGAYAMRATVVFTLQVAATPFHQGVVVLSSQYRDSANATFSRNNAFYACTNVNHVRCDINNTTMVQLKIPYLSEEEAQVIGGAGGTISSNPWFFMSVVQMLPTPLPSSILAARLQLFMHLEDIEFFGAIPQVTSTLTPQSGIKAAEVEEAAYPLSSSVKAAAKSLTLASRAIPLLSPILSTPTWFLQCAGNALRSFGFSKPIVRDPITRHVRFSSVGEHNVDVASGCFSLAPTSTNSLATDAVLGTTDVDEMSLEYVLSQWGQVMYGTITTAQGSGQTIYYNQLSPLAQWYRNTLGTAAAATVPANYQAPLTATATTNAFFPSSLMAVSQMFRLYRGGFQFRVTFAKTKFHGGRVLFTYNPLAGSTTLFAPTAGAQAQTTGESVIFDLRDSNVFEFECPFVETVPALGLANNFGSFTMTLVNQLVSTSTVSSSVDFLVEVRASPGFNLAVPAGFQWPSVSTGATIGPIVGIGLTSTNLFLAPASRDEVEADSQLFTDYDTFEAQSGTTVTTATMVPETFTRKDTKYTFGEDILSLKQLIMMPKLTNCGVVPANGGDYVGVPPWWYNNMSSARLVPSPNTFLPESFGTPGNIAQWYAFVNGGTETHFYTPGRPANTCMAQWNGQNYNGLNNTNTFLQTPASNVSRVLAVDDQPLHFVVPPYQRVRRMRPAWIAGVNWVPKFGDANRFPTFIPNNNGPSTMAKIRVFNNSVDTLAGWMTRCAADDARCAVYQGPLPMALPGASVVGIYDPDSIVLD